MDQGFAFLPETKVSVDVLGHRLRSPFTVAGPYRIFTGFPLSRLSPEHKLIYFCFFDFAFFAFSPSSRLFALILTLSISIVHLISHVFLSFYRCLAVFQDFLIEKHIKSGFLTLFVLICLSQGSCPYNGVN